MRPLWQKATWLGIASYLRRQHFCDATWALTREGIMGTRFCNATWALTREGKMGTRFCNATWALTREGKMGTVYQGWQCLPSTESPRAERYLFEIGYLRIRVRDGTSRPAWDGLSGVAVHANSTKRHALRQSVTWQALAFPNSMGVGIGKPRRDWDRLMQVAVPCTTSLEAHRHLAGNGILQSSHER